MVLVWHGKAAREVRENLSGFFVPKIYVPTKPLVRPMKNGCREITLRLDGESYAFDERDA